MVIVLLIAAAAISLALGARIEAMAIVAVLGEGNAEAAPCHRRWQFACYIRVQ